MKIDRAERELVSLERPLNTLTRKGASMSDATLERLKTAVQIKRIPGWKDYYIDSFGHVYSECNGRMLFERRPHKSNGYLMMSLGRCRALTVSAVHRLVLLTFIGPCPKGMQGCHNDGNKLNNHVSNLRWDTVKNNIHDKFRHGTMPLGERHHKSKLTESNVIEIRSLIGKVRVMELARRFGVSKSTILFIKNRRTWRHIA